MKPFLLYRLLLLIVFMSAGFLAAAQNDKATATFIDSLKQTIVLHNDSIAVQDTTAEQADSVKDDQAGVGLQDDEPRLDTAIFSNLRAIPADSLQIIKKDKGFYYQQWLDSILRAEEAARKNPKLPRKLDMPDFSLLFAILKIVLWLIAAAIVIFVVYKLFLSKNGLFVSNKKNIEMAPQSIPPTTPEEYEQLLAKAEAAADYRLAVRFRYLQSLEHLAGRGYIVKGFEKTNYQYISEVRKRSVPVANLFAALSLKYEYSWYGAYPVSNTLYQSLKTSFEQLYTAMK